MPEWRVLQSADGASQRSGQEAEHHMESFRRCFRRATALSRMRLKVDNSAVQVSVREVGRKGRERRSKQHVCFWLLVFSDSSRVMLCLSLEHDLPRARAGGTSFITFLSHLPRLLRIYCRVVKGVNVLLDSVFIYTLSSASGLVSCCVIEYRNDAWKS